MESKSGDDLHLFIEKLARELGASTRLIMETSDTEVRENIIEIMQSLSSALDYLRYLQDVECFFHSAGSSKLRELLNNVHCNGRVVAILIKEYAGLDDVDFAGSELAGDEVKRFLLSGIADVEKVEQYRLALIKFVVDRDRKDKDPSHEMSLEKIMRLLERTNPELGDVLVMLSYYFDHLDGSVEELAGYNIPILACVSEECLQLFLQGGRPVDSDIRLIMVVLPEVLRARSE
ncbi:hypothetical protein JKY72_02420 [Candidatus Gracilibacteria bacterium]|nr:hypothetical protein [Candidatus Gracilibacteria bacterium]